MSENTIETTEAAAPTDSDAAPSERDGGGNREAARYRTQLREAQAERDALLADHDALAERLGTLQRREAERVAGEHLADAADLWRDGLTLAELLDDDGNLDPGKVGGAARTVVEAHKHWAAPGPRPRPSLENLRSGTRVEHRPPTSWASVINSRGGDN